MSNLAGEAELVVRKGWNDWPVQSWVSVVAWAPLGNPCLVTIVPYVSPDDHHDNEFTNGAFQLAKALDQIAVYGDSRTNNADLEIDFYDWNKLYKQLPLSNLDEKMMGRTIQLWQDFMDHPDNDYYWRFSVGDLPAPAKMSEGKYPQLNVPALNITGWYDSVQQSTINNYIGMVSYGPQALRKKHHLIVGPWQHQVGRRIVGDFDFGLQASRG